MRMVLFSALAATSVWLPAQAIAQDARQNFMLVNRPGYELKELYVGPTKSDDWGDDILGQDTLDDGARVKINFSPKVRTCKWDLKVVYSVDSSNAVWTNIDLCTVEKITIHYDKDRDVTRATFD